MTSKCVCSIEPNGACVYVVFKGALHKFPIYAGKDSYGAKTCAIGSRVDGSTRVGSSLIEGLSLEVFLQVRFDVVTFWTHEESLIF